MQSKYAPFTSFVLITSSLGLTAACGTSTTNEDKASVATVSQELYLLGTKWPNGTVPVCWTSMSTSRADFPTLAATVRKRANEEWPTAAKISFTGWKACPVNPAGMVSLNLNNATGSGARGIGYFGRTELHRVELGTLTANFADNMVPRALGAVLGFGDEFNRPDFDNTIQRDCQGTDVSGGDTLGTVPDINSIMASRSGSGGSPPGPPGTGGIPGGCRIVNHLSAIDRQGAVVAYGPIPNHFTTPVEWGTWSGAFDFRLADVNGDRRADIVGRFGVSVQVALSVGTSFIVSSQWTTWGTNFDLQLADVDRDGRADIVGRSGSDVQVALSTGSSFLMSSHWATWPVAYDLKLADVDGDGRADIVGRSGSDVRVALSTGAGFSAPRTWTAWNSGYDLQLADVNGDGRADIVGRSGDVQVALSTGDSFSSPSTRWTMWSSGYDLQLADVNGDGRADIVGRSGDVQVGMSTGSSFAPSTQWTTFGSGYTLSLADTNGDGRSDIVGRAVNGVSIQVGPAAN